MPEDRASPSAPAARNTCLVLVTLNPEAGLADRMEPVRRSLGATIVVDNGSHSDRLPLLPEGKGFSPCHFVRNGENRGLAAGLNQGWDEAARRGFEWVLFLDQDTEPEAALFPELASVAAQAGTQAGVIGSNYFDEHKQRRAVSCRGGGGRSFVERKTVITSGTLVPVSLLKKLGGFRVDYFIDSLDHEFCLRARRDGWRVVISCRPLMKQQIGGPAKHLGLLGGLGAFVHTPERKYYIARNTVLTVRQYLFNEPAWCFRQGFRMIAELFYVVFFEREKRRKLKGLLLGFLHGIAGKSGPLRANL